MKSLAERLEAAETLAPGERDRRILHGPVEAHWSSDSRSFWYVSRTASGRQWQRVDATSRTRRPLFDAAALAAAFRVRGLDARDAGSLPLTDLRVDETSAVVSFRAFDAAWTWSDACAELAAEANAFAVGELPSPDGSCAVSLDGNELQLRSVGSSAFVRLTAGGEADFGWGTFIDFVTEVSRRLSPMPQRPAVLWSPDSRRFAVFRHDLRGIGHDSLLQSVPPSGRRPVVHRYAFPYASDFDRERVELWIVDRVGGRVRVAVDPIEACSHRPIDQGQLRWSVDCRWLYLVDGNAAGTRVVLWRIDPWSGTATRLVEEAGVAIVRASPTLGEPPIFHVLADGRIVWWSQQSGWGHLVLIDGDRRTPLTSGRWQVRALLHVDEVAGRLMFRAGGRQPDGNPYHDQVYGVDLKGGEPVLLTPEAAHHETTAADVSASGRAFVDVWSTVSQAPCSVLRGCDGSLLMDLESAEVADARPLDLALPEAFSIPATDGGEAIWGVVYRPWDVDESKRHPVIELIYAAPQSSMVPRSWSPGAIGAVAEQLAVLGFVAVIVDGRGTPYRSHAFQLAAFGRTEECGLHDHVRALRTLGASRPWMDLDRVGVMGASGGGYATVRAMATYPDFYRAGVAMCGNHDQAAYLPLWGETFQGQYEKALYDRQDNALVAGKIVGDLMLVHGDMDDNVHPAHTMRLADALIRAGRRFEMLIVPNGGHLLVSLPYVRRRAWDFFFERLTGVRLPWPASTAPTGDVP